MMGLTLKDLYASFIVIFLFGFMVFTTTPFGIIVLRLMTFITLGLCITVAPPETSRIELLCFALLALFVIWDILP